MGEDPMKRDGGEEREHLLVTNLHTARIRRLMYIARTGGSAFK
jgi:hypothetical protein